MNSEFFQVYMLTVVHQAMVMVSGTSLDHDSLTSEMLARKAGLTLTMTVIMTMTMTVTVMKTVTAKKMVMNDDEYT